MAQRTINAVGSIVNNGNVASTYRVRLASQRHANVSFGGVDDIGPLLESKSVASGLVTVPAGGQSAQLTLTGTMTLSPTDWIVAIVRLDRTYPQPANNIDQGTVNNFQEAVVALPAGTLSGFSPTYANKFALTDRGVRARRQLARVRR